MDFFFKFKLYKIWILTKSLFIVEGIWHTWLQIIYLINNYFSLQYEPK